MILASVSSLMTPKSVLSKKNFVRPFVIRPQEFPNFETLVAHRDEIRDLRLVPVKDEETHDRYNSIDKDALMRDLLETMGESRMVLMPNEFPYWLPEDVDQNIMWVKDGTSDLDVAKFLGWLVQSFELPNEHIIIFERPFNVDAALVKGTFPLMRHIHVWVKS